MSFSNKLIPLAIALISFMQPLFAQDEKDQLFALDENWKGTDLKNARYLYHVKKLSDTCWQWDSYNIIGPLIKTEYYKDKDASIAHGQFYFYNAKGRIDSIHDYKNGLAEGSFYYFNDTGAVVLEKKFHNGILYDSIDKLKRKVEVIRDSLQSMVFTKVESESEFPGANGGWKRYLEKNFVYPERAINNKIQGMVIVQFIVDKEGKIQDPRIFKSVEYSIDEEALRIIRKSPRWIPAQQNGRLVKSYKRQPIIFQLQ